jgi:hypothetical protein
LPAIPRLVKGGEQWRTRKRVLLFDNGTTSAQVTISRSYSVSLCRHGQRGHTRGIKQLPNRPINPHAGSQPATGSTKRCRCRAAYYEPFAGAVSATALNIAVG